MPWDTVPSANYEKLNRVEPVIADLKKRSEMRVASDKSFSLLNDDIELVKQQMARKTVSLNEQKRMAEKVANEERNKKRKAELASLATPKTTVYLVTLRDVDKPGLTLAPPPKAPAKSQVDRQDPSAPISTDEPTTPTKDLLLTEAERILLDYVEVSGKLAIR